MLAAVAAAGVLFGTVTIGPVTPVCRAGTPCSRPAKGIMLTFSRAGRSVVARTDARGRYRVQLARGTWSVRASAGLRSTPTRLLVRSGSHRADITLDTGIR